MLTNLAAFQKETGSLQETTSSLSLPQLHKNAGQSSIVKANYDHMRIDDMQATTILDNNINTIMMTDPSATIEQNLNTSSFGKSQPKQGK